MKHNRLRNWEGAEPCEPSRSHVRMPRSETQSLDRRSRWPGAGLCKRRLPRAVRRPW